MATAKSEFRAPETIDEDIINEVGGAKALQDMPEYQISGLKVRPPKVLTPKESLSKYYKGPVNKRIITDGLSQREIEMLQQQAAEENDRLARIRAAERARREKKRMAADAARKEAGEDGDDGEEHRSSAPRGEDTFPEKPEEREIYVEGHNGDIGSDEEWVEEELGDINERIGETGTMTKANRAVHYQKKDALDQQKRAGGPRRMAAPVVAKGFTLKQPVIIPCPYGEKWSIDLVAIWHNSIKRELLDMYRIVESLGKRMIDLRHTEIDDFYNWWEVFEGFILEYFDIEEKILYPWLNERIDLKATDLNQKQRTMEKGTIIRILREMDDCEESFAYLPAGEVFPRLVALIDKFSPRLMSYFSLKERILPPLIDKRFAEDDKLENDKVTMKHIMANCQFPTETVILLTRWLNDAQKKHWQRTNLKGAQRVSYNGWYEEMRKSHMAYVDEFKERLVTFKAEQAQKAAEKAAMEMEQRRLRMLREANQKAAEDGVELGELPPDFGLSLPPGAGDSAGALSPSARTSAPPSGKLPDGSVVLNTIGGPGQPLAILPPGAKAPKVYGPATGAKEPKWAKEGKPAPYTGGEEGAMSPVAGTPKAKTVTIAAGTPTSPKSGNDGGDFASFPSRGKSKSFRDGDSPSMGAPSKSKTFTGLFSRQKTGSGKSTPRISEP